TGFQQSQAVSAYLLPGKIAAFVLTVSGTFTALTCGSLAVVRILRLPHSDARVVITAILTQAVAIVVGAAVLLARDRTIFEAVFQPASAFGNCGLYIGTLGGVAEWT